MHHRETLMKSLPGFAHCKLTKTGNEYVFSQEWETKQVGGNGIEMPLSIIIFAKKTFLFFFLCSE